MQPLDHLTPPDYVTRLRNITALLEGSAEQIEGCDQQTLKDAAQRLGFELPQALQQFYLTVGKVDSAMRAFHAFEKPEDIVNYTGTEEDMHAELSPEQLLELQGDLVFASENQGTWFARYRQDNGEVYLDEMTEDAEHPDDKTHHHLASNLEEAILWLLANQGLNLNLDLCEIFVDAQHTPEFLEKLHQYFCAYTTEVDEICGNVFYNPELGMVLIGGTGQDGDFHGYLFTDDSAEDEFDDDDDGADDVDDEDEDENGKFAEFSRTFPQVELSFL